MPGDTFTHGDDPNTLPLDGAIWRSYYEAAERVLKIYAENQSGIYAVAVQMQCEKWAYRDRSGKPTLFEGDDVRRIVANWAQYGGYVPQEKHRARELNPYLVDVEQVPLDAERAVFPLDLLREVGRIRKERTSKPVDRAKSKKTFLIHLA